MNDKLDNRHKEHKLFDDERDITVEFLLRLVNNARSTDELVREVATFFQGRSPAAMWWASGLNRARIIPII